MVFRGRATSAIKEATGGHGVDAAANAANAGAATALRAVADGGRLATITSDPPEPERGTAVESLYVRPDATQLERATDALGAGLGLPRLAVLGGDLL